MDYDVPWVCKVVTVSGNGFSDDGDIDDLELRCLLASRAVSDL